MRFAFPPRAAAALAALCWTLPALADPATQTQPRPPRFAGAANPSPEPSVAAPAPVPETAAAGAPAYEKQRIKRTVPVDPRLGLEGRWDLLHAQGAGEDRRAVYLDWDDDFLYLAAESGRLSEVRFDIDGRGDGWFRGADNLRIAVTPPVGARAGNLSAQRWDAVQNRDRPVWAASPIPAAEIKVAVGPTPQGTQAILLAVPRTEATGLLRRSGADFGMHVEWGPTDEAAAYAPRPMLPLTLADAREARDPSTGLRVRVGVSPREVVPGEGGVKMTLEVKNEGARPARIARLFLRGSQAAQVVLDAATFTGQVLMPGDTVSRSFFSTVSGAAGLGAIVVAGGVEWADGSALPALAAFDRRDRFGMSLKIDPTPVAAGSGDSRTVLVSVLSRSNNKTPGTVRIDLPGGWILQGGKPERGVTLRFAGETTGTYFKIVVPPTAAPGAYPIRAEVRIGGRIYTEEGRIVVEGAAPGQ